MKKSVIILMIMFMSMSTSAFAGTKISTESNVNLTSIVIPTNFMVKQSVTFNDGSKIYLYYQKRGDVCKLFSTADISKYKESDVMRIKSTNFEVVDNVKGKCYITCKIGDLIDFARSFLKNQK